jgi:alpha-glucosidase
MMHARRFIGFVGIALLGCSLGAHAQQSAPATLAEQQAQSGLPANSTKAAFTSITSAHDLPNGVEVVSGAARMSIIALRDDILRIRASATATLPEDASWAVATDTRAKNVAVELRDDATSVGFRTKLLDVRIDRATARLIISDLKGNIISADALGHTTSFENGSFRVWKTLPQDEHFFGLGDKTGPLDRRDQAFYMWNTDSFGFQESTDPIYKTIPFFLAINHGTSYGIFLDNTWRSNFDFGRSERLAYSFGSEGGPLDYYFVYGPEPKQVVEDYAWLTGTPPLPPLWSLGYQQSRYTYTPASRLREVADQLRKDKIPADVLWLDIDFQDRNRPFTVDAKTFPDMANLLADLRAQHFHTIAVTDLHVAKAPDQNYAPYDTGLAGDHFVHNPDGSVFTGVVWPGPSVFPDFTQWQSRDWWGTNYKQFVADGFAGFWNDMNEPSVFDGPGKTMPLTTIHRIEEPGFATRTATHTEIHNVYGMLNSRGTYEGVLKLQPNERPFVMTRASYPGGQRYSVTWTGDNSATWNHLRMSTTMLENLGLSGFAFAGADVGGFANSPQPGLLTKWLELAAFQPIDRDHSAKGTADHEPWVNGPHNEDVARKFIDTRYRLLPYLYTVAEENSRTGVPIIRPLFLEFPHATSDGHPVDLDAGGEFMFGPSLLIAPPAFPDTLDAYSLNLPGDGWFDFWTGKRMPAIPSEAEMKILFQASPDGSTMLSPAAQAAMKAINANRIQPTEDALPVYVRAGSIIPMQAVVQSTDETPQGPLELRVYPNSKPGSGCKGSLYLDDGHTFQYKQGEYLRTDFTCETTANGVSVKIGPRQGSFSPWWKQIEVVIYDWQQKSTNATINGQHVESHVNKDDLTAHTLVQENAAGSELLLSK